MDFNKLCSDGFPTAATRNIKSEKRKFSSLKEDGSVRRIIWSRLVNSAAAQLQLPHVHHSHRIRTVIINV